MLVFCCVFTLVLLNIFEVSETEKLIRNGDDDNDDDYVISRVFHN